MKLCRETEYGCNLLLSSVDDFRWDLRIPQETAAGENSLRPLEFGSLDAAEEIVEHREVCGELWVALAYGRHVVGGRDVEEAPWG